MRGFLGPSALLQVKGEQWDPRLEAAPDQCPLPGGRGLADTGVRGAAAERTLLLLVSGFRAGTHRRADPRAPRPELGRCAGKRALRAGPGRAGAAPPREPGGRGAGRAEGCGRTPGFRSRFAFLPDSPQGNSGGFAPGRRAPPRAGRTVVRGSGLAAAAGGGFLGLLPLLL